HGTHGVTFEMLSRGEGSPAKMVDVIPRLHLNARVAGKQITSKIKLPLVGGNAIQLDQRQFHFRMAGEQRFLVRARTEIRKQEVIYKTDARVEQSAIVGGAVVSDSALQEVTHVVKFVAPLLGSRLHSLRSMVADVIRVQVSVGLLRGNDVLRDFVHGCAKLGPLAGLQSETGSSGPPVNVGIGVHRPALRGRALSDEAAEIIHA